MNILRNSRLLGLVSDAFALAAFVLPLFCLASGAFYFTLGHAPDKAGWNIFLATAAMTAIAVCGLGGLVFTVAGGLQKQRRVLWQGVFGLCVSAALGCVGWGVAAYVGVLI